MVLPESTRSFTHNVVTPTETTAKSRIQRMLRSCRRFSALEGSDEIFEAAVKFCVEQMER